MIAQHRVPSWLGLPLLVVGGTMVACGLGMLACAGVGAIGDGRAVAALAVPGAAAGALGAVLIGFARGGARSPVTVRVTTGFAAVTLAWLVAAALGSIPFLAAGTFGSVIDAYFEAMSGFTTTGSTLLGEIEPEPDGVLMWRQLIQWLGGIGIVVLVVAIAPLSVAGIQRVFYAETSGIGPERLTPRIVDTAKILAAIYGVLTLACAVAYVVAGMGGFDAVGHAFSTVATAGFSTKTASIGHFDSVAIEAVSIVFMLSGGVNFALYWRAIRRQPLLPPLAEVRAYLAIVAVGIGAVAISVLLAGDADGAAASLRAAAFSVVSLATTTGYVTVDFDRFNEFARLALLGLMVIGACAGSTAGGLKVVRAVLLIKSAGHEIRHQIEPRAVHVLRLGGRTFSEDARRAVLGFSLVYALILLVGAFLIAASGLDPVTAFSGSVATLNLVGPGLGDIGAQESFEAFPPFARIVAIALMLIGRLEVFTVVALLAAVFGFRRRR